MKACIAGALTLCLATAASAQPAPAPADAQNPAVVATIALVQASYNGYKPSITPGGGFINITVNTANGAGRTHMVSISTGSYGLAGSPVRNLSAVVAKLPSPVDTALLLRLLKENTTNLGAWSMSTDAAGVNSIKYNLDMPANPSSETLVASINKAANMADKLELELTSKDEF